ncbi:MAG: bifunctional histidinol-phosphatase/imidazoleglycerol-phosphate dehydratase HisB [Bacteroidota bacterium]
MKKVLFIDRDGTLIKEPPEDFQVDSFDKLKFMPGVFRELSKISKALDYELVMVTNQDGLGTDSFPENTFWPAHNFMLEALKGEGINFSDIYIDKTFEKDNAPTRKPRTALLTRFMEGDYDLERSFVIGDRLTDIDLAKNLNCKGILLRNELNGDVVTSESLKDALALDAQNWEHISSFLMGLNRKSIVVRKTRETDISIRLDLDGSGASKIDTGLSFFDHMLDQIAKHSGFDLEIKVNGDLEVDEHHTIEDTAIALGEAVHLALAKKVGIDRYGFSLPMDDVLAQVSLDFGGRSWIVWETEFKREKVGDMPSEMFYHFFKSFSDSAKCNLNIKCEGDNEHHKIESIFKALARAMKMAVRRDKSSLILPSTKGVL